MWGGHALCRLSGITVNFVTSPSQLLATGVPTLIYFYGKHFFRVSTQNPGSENSTVLCPLPPFLYFLSFEINTDGYYKTHF